MEKKISHSEITTYLDCQKKWDLIYNKGLRLENKHLKFGSMGHKVLETGIIPEEELYTDLKEEFNISSWKDYFEPILDEINDFLKDYDVVAREYKFETETIKGVIDIVLKHKKTNKILIMDYKFSNGTKGSEDLFLDEQLYLYGICYAMLNDLTFDDLEVGYISIPKTELNKPRVLKSGQLSRDKGQNTTFKKYVETIKELGLNIEDYEEFLSEISGRTLLTIVKTDINRDMAKRIAKNIDNVIKDMQKDYVLEKCTYMCKSCDCVDYCKRGKMIQ